MAFIEDWLAKPKEVVDDNLHFVVAESEEEARYAMYPVEKLEEETCNKYFVGSIEDVVDH